MCIATLMGLQVGRGLGSLSRAWLRASASGWESDSSLLFGSLCILEIWAYGHPCTKGYHSKELWVAKKFQWESWHPRRKLCRKEEWTSSRNELHLLHPWLWWRVVIFFHRSILERDWKITAGFPFLSREGKSLPLIWLHFPTFFKP